MEPRAALKKHPPLSDVFQEAAVTCRMQLTKYCLLMKHLKASANHLHDNPDQYQTEKKKEQYHFQTVLPRLSNMPTTVSGLAVTVDP